MAPADHTPIYNLKAVVQETGLKPDTLRAWERRYGIPTPQRTTSGHRLYSQADMAMLHWLIARQEEGLSISRAVELWRRMEEEGESPAPQGDGHAPGGRATLPLPGSADDALRDLRERWVGACLRFDEQAAEAVLSHSFALFPPEIVCAELLQRGLAAIGDQWYHGRATVQQEHFASALALRRLQTLIASTPPPTRLGRILIGCAPQEEHTFAPLLLTLLLRRRGWDTIYLGPNVPAQQLDETVLVTRPNLVILTAHQLPTAATLLEAGEALLIQRVPLAFGGLIFNRLPELHKVIPGHFLGARLDEAPQVVESLMANLRPQLAQRSTPHDLRVALAHLRERRSLLEAALAHAPDELQIPPRILLSANHHFGESIAAALALGNLEYLTADMDWIEGLLTLKAGMSPLALEGYLESYLRAAEETLDERGGPVVAWLARIVAANGRSYPSHSPTARRHAG